MTLDVKTALENLINASGHISPLNGEASVKAVRLAGKYMKALDEARQALEQAERCPYCNPPKLPPLPSGELMRIIQNPKKVRL